jgi:hypothetical protein
MIRDVEREQLAFYVYKCNPIEGIERTYEAHMAAPIEQLRAAFVEDDWSSYSGTELVDAVEGDEGRMNGLNEVLVLLGEQPEQVGGFTDTVLVNG